MSSLTKHSARTNNSPKKSKPFPETSGKKATKLLVENRERIVSSSPTAGRLENTNHYHHHKAPSMMPNETSSELVMTAAAALTSLTKQSIANSMAQSQTNNHFRALGMIPDSNSLLHFNRPQQQQTFVVQEQSPSASRFATTLDTMLVPQQIMKTTKHKATRFPVKLMQILSSGLHDNIISWTPDGLSFVVKKPNLLVSEVLPSYFKEVKYSSFTRKLHRWGFIKILRGKELSAYFHKNFRRGNVELCARMHCSKGSGSSEEVDASYLVQQDIVQRTAGGLERETPLRYNDVDLQDHLAREHSAFHGLSRHAVNNSLHDHDNTRRDINKMHNYYHCPSLERREAMAFQGSMSAGQHQPFFNQEQTYFSLQHNNAGPSPPPHFSNPPHHPPPMLLNNGMPRSAVGATLGGGLDELERARHSIHHRRIMQDAWNALSWESKMTRASRGKTVHPNSTNL